MLIPGIVIAVFTFPGVIVHEFAHQLMCWLLRVPVIEVCYFRLRLRGPAGYVRHGIPPSGWANLAIATGPFFVNTLLGFAIAFPVAIRDHLGLSTPSELLAAWLGISIATHSFPSVGDAANIWKMATGRKNSILERMVAIPIVGIIWLGAVGSVFWLDVIYGGFVAMFLPGYILHGLSAI